MGMLFPPGCTRTSADVRAQEPCAPTHLVGAATATQTEADANAFATLLRMLWERYGIDFANYKSTTLRRRVERRLRLHTAFDLSRYVQWLAVEPRELERLYRDLLIGVTRFFRDPQAFDYLAQEIVDPLVKSQASTAWPKYVTSLTGVP